MNVLVSGDGPALAAVTAALSDADAEPEHVDPRSVGEADVAVVVAGDGETVRTAGRAAREGGTRLLLVEFGGLGGHALGGVEATVAGVGPGVGCVDCLATRVAANAERRGERPEPDAPTRRLAGAVAGRAATALLAGSDGPLGRVRELPHAERSFLPVPGCDCADDPPDATLARVHESVPVEAALDRMEQALDDRVGVVSEVGEIESFPAPYYMARNADTTGFSDAAAPGQAAGVDADWNRAFAKALGEALERYGAGVYRESAFRRAPPSALDTDGDGSTPGPEAVSPAAMVGPEDGAVDPDQPIPWVGGANLATEEAALLPAEAVRFPPPETRYLTPITTGLGLGTSQVGALLSGLYEVVERDATMLAWYSTVDPLELAVDDDGYETLARRARSEDLSVTSLLVTVDVDVPVVATAVHREGDWPRFAVGSGADLDPVAAARSSLAEAIQNWMELRSMGPDGAAAESGAIGRYAEFPAAARSFLEVDGAVPADSVGPDAVPAGVVELDALVDRVRDAGLTPYAARLTPRDLRAVDLEVVRAVVPGAQPLFTGEPSFGERARTVPESLGFEARLDREHHPYP
jgi:ribosomal protein S12 methylthiotransferase accessory factor